jgi:hypothetical protein
MNVECSFQFSKCIALSWIVRLRAQLILTIHHLLYNRHIVIPISTWRRTMPFQLVYYSQQDPRWKTNILGFGDPGDTIGYVGCALTSTAMLLSGHGYTETPKTLNEKLKNVGGFVSAAIVWGAVHQIYPQVSLKGFIPCATTDAPLATIDASIAAGQPVIVMVDSSPAGGLQTHWIVLYAKEGNDYLMLDPWPYQTDITKKTYMMPRYAQGKTLQHAIMHVILYEVTGSGGPITDPSTTATARVKADVIWGLNIRSSIDTSSTANIVVVAPSGTLLTLLEADGDAKVGAVNQWVRVREPGGREGFAAAWYLEKVTGTVDVPPVDPGSSSNQLIVMVKGKVGKFGARIYESASNGSITVSTEATRAKLIVLEDAKAAKAKIGKNGKWINVQTESGKQGFVDGGLVKLP